MMGNVMSLVIKNLKVVVANQPVVNDLSLEIKPAEIVVLMGPNGSGKTSAGYALMGHPDYQISAGQVLLDRRSLLGLSPHERSQAGLFLAFQYPVVVEGVRYEKFLWESYQVRFKNSSPRTAKRVESIIDFRQHLAKLAQELAIKPSLLRRSLNAGFSGGEKKRLEILQLLLLEPKYAVLDETDSGLDIDAIKIAAQGIKKSLVQLKTGILLITHYRRLLDYLNPTKVCIFKKGKVVARGGFGLIEKLEKDGY